MKGVARRHSAAILPSPASSAFLCRTSVFFRYGEPSSSEIFLQHEPRTAFISRYSGSPVMRNTEKDPSDIDPKEKEMIQKSLETTSSSDTKLLVWPSDDPNVPPEWLDSIRLHQFFVQTASVQAAQTTDNAQVQFDAFLL